MSAQATNYPDLVVVTHEMGKESKPEAGLTRRVLAYNDKLFVAEHRAEAGWMGAMHRHPHDQVVYVVRGHLALHCQGKTVDLRGGDSFAVRGGVEHGASALDDTLFVDVFTPCREEYIS